MSNFPVFYVDEVMHLLNGEEFKVLMFMAHKIIGDKIPFDGEQFARLHLDDISKGTGLSPRKVNNCVVVLVTYGLVVMANSSKGVGWMLGALEDVDLAGLAQRRAEK